MRVYCVRFENIEVFGSAKKAISRVREAIPDGEVDNVSITKWSDAGLVGLLKDKGFLAFYTGINCTDIEVCEVQ